METNYTLKRLKLIWPVFALFMFASLFVNAQEKNTRTLHLNIECVGQVAVAGSAITDRTIQGPVVMSDLGDGSPIALNAIIYFEPMTDVVNPCYGFTGWEVTNQDGDVFAWDDVIEAGTYTLGLSTFSYRLVLSDNYILTAYFGLETDPLTPFEVNFTNATPISTITGTPVIVPVTMVYGDVSLTDCEVGWVVDAMVRITHPTTGALMLPPGAEFLEVTYEGTPIPLVAPVLTSAEFMLSDIIGGPAPLLGHLNSSFNWTYTIIASPTIGAAPVVYNVEIISVTMEAGGGCPTVLARNNFDISYDKVDMEVTSPFGCVAEKLCFSVTIDYPTIANIGEKVAPQGVGYDISDQIHNNLYIAGPFTAGMEVSVSGMWNGVYISGDWTIPGNVSLTGFYLSQILANSVSAGTEYGQNGGGWALKNAGAADLEICVKPLGLGETKFELSAVAQLEIFDFAAKGAHEEFVLQDFEYGNTTATLTSDPKFKVEYQKSTLTAAAPWAVNNSDKVCGREYELRARVTPTPTGTTVPAGEWRVDLGLIPSGANVTFEDKTSPTTDVVVSSFGVYRFYWHIFNLTDNQKECGDFGIMTVGFYPSVVSTLSVTEANAKVCSLATTITRTKNVDLGGASNALLAADWELTENWVVTKWTYNHAAVAPVEKWAFRPITDLNGFPTITQVGTTNNFVFNAANRGDFGYGKYRIVYNTSMVGKNPIPNATLCSSTADTIYVELYWKPIADIVFSDYDVCEFGLYHATTNNIDPVILRGSLPKSVTYAAGTGVVVEPYVNGKGQWTQTAGPAVTYVKDFGDLTKREIKFHVPTYGTYTFQWTVTNDAAGIPCENPAVAEYTITFPEPAMANVNTADLIYCFTQVKWESYMDVITGTNAYKNPVFTGAAGEAGKIQINKNWVTNYNGNALPLNATKSAGGTGTWSVTQGNAAHVAFVLPTTAGVAPDPRVASTWTTTGAVNAGNAIAVFLHPGKYELTWTVVSACDEDADSFEVEFLASPDPLKILEVTAGGEIVPPRPVCVGEPVHYILRRTTTNLDPVPGDNDIIWDIPANFEVLATGGGAGIKQYWVKGVWTAEVAGANFEVEEFGHPIHGCSTINKFDPVLYKASQPAVTISGPTTVPAGIAQTYSVPAPAAGAPALTYTWTIVGGTITSGIGTREVTVMWGATAPRTLKVELTGNYCNPVVVSPTITVTVEQGMIAGQIRYWNAEETFMPSPFNTVFQGGEVIPDYFYVELHTATAAGVPTGLVERVATKTEIVATGESYRTYFEFEDVDPTLNYVIRVLDGGYFVEGREADARLAYTYTWRNWGGANATDALAIQLMVAEEELNAAPYNWTWVGDVADDYGFFSFETADVNSSGTLTLIDNLTLQYRVVGINAQFPNNTPNFRVAGRWVDALGEVAGRTWPQAFDADVDLVFNKQAANYLGTTNANAHGYISEVFALGAQVNKKMNIYYVATGDVNSSYVPPAGGLKEDSFSTIALEYVDVIEASEEIVHIPVRINQAAEVGAITFGVTFDNNLIEVIDVNYNMSNINNEEGWFRVASTDAQSFAANQAVMIVTAKVLADLDGAQLFALEPITEFADRNARVLDITLNTDAVSTKSATSITDPSVANLSISNYPNPFTTSTTIEYTLPEAGNVTLVVYNNVGQIVTTLVSEAKEAGLHQAILNRSDINGDGMYIYKIFVEGQSRSYTATGNVVLMK